MRIIAILMLLSTFVGCTRHHVETITIKGSDTEVNLVLQLAEAYMDTDPEVSVNVTEAGAG